MSTVGSYSNPSQGLGGQGDPADTPGCPTFSSKLRHDFAAPGTTISTAFANMYTYSGVGKLIGFVLDFDNNNIQLKLTIDSEIIFDLSVNDIQDTQVSLGAGVDDMSNSGGGPIWNQSDKKILYQPLCPIVYNADIVIDAKKTTGPDKTLTRYLINLTKES